MTPSPGPYPFTVTLENGNTERIILKPLTITQLYGFINLFQANSEIALVALCTGKEQEWIESLSIESFGALAGKCAELNFPRAVLLAKSGAVVAAALIGPLIQKNAYGLTAVRILSAPSGDLLKTQEPSASAPGTASGSPTPSASAASSPPSLAAAA